MNAPAKRGPHSTSNSLISSSAKRAMTARRSKAARRPRQALDSGRVLRTQRSIGCGKYQCAAAVEQLGRRRARQHGIEQHAQRLPHP